uniref:DnaJ homologue subfamily C member 28 conserved domain-containing protein n=1 Tax=Chrysotila carterae TaxID=13221 RepID=A0A7S4BSZ6_CHRCT
MVDGAFDNLPGAGKPLPTDENVFEAISGEALAHRILKNAGCAPPWVERGKEIRVSLQRAKEVLALDVARMLLNETKVNEMKPSARANETLGAHGSVLSTAAAAVALAHRHASQRQLTSIHRHDEQAEQKDNKPDASATVNTHKDSAVKNDGNTLAKISSHDEIAIAASLLADSTEALAFAQSAAEAGDSISELSHAQKAISAALLQCNGRLPIWDDLRRNFDAKVMEINKQIMDYNLIAPNVAQQICSLNSERELAAALKAVPQQASTALHARPHDGRRGVLLTSGQAGDIGYFDMSTRTDFAVAEPVSFSIFSLFAELFTPPPPPPPQQLVRHSGPRMIQGSWTIRATDSHTL